MLYSIDKQLLLENVSLLEEEMSPMARRGMKLAGAGGVGALAHAGTFGSGVKNAVDGTYDAVKGMAQTAGSKAGSSLTDAGKFYGNKESAGKVAGGHTDTTGMNHQQAKVETGAQDHANTSADVDASDDEDGLGVLGSIGAATVAGGLGYLGYKGAKSKAGKTIGRGIATGAKAAGHSTMNAARTAGSGLNSTKRKLGAGFTGFKKGFSGN